MPGAGQVSSYRWARPRLWWASASWTEGIRNSQSECTSSYSRSVVGLGVGGPVGLRVGGEHPQRGGRPLGGDLADVALDGHEQPILVAGVPHDQLHIARGPVRQ